MGYITKPFTMREIRDEIFEAQIGFIKTMSTSPTENKICAGCGAIKSNLKCKYCGG